MHRYRVKPGEKVDLSKWDANDENAFDGSKAELADTLASLYQELGQLQELLYAEHKHKLLIVLQAMDTGGKDSTIRRVFSAVNPQGVRVASFKAPTAEELDHDFLWRIHQQVPEKGEIVIFNRSHYEDVLIARVRNLVPREVWHPRHDHINDFERMLSDEGMIILKFFLHIDNDEQLKRLRERLEDPRKRWKFDPSDLQERKLWPEYMRAYEDVLSKTSTAWAPWYIVPANRKKQRDLVVASTIVESLSRLDMHYPEAAAELPQHIS